MAGETVIGALRYDFTADTSGLKSGLYEVTNSVRQVTDQLRTNSRQFEQLGKSSAQAVGLARHEMVNLTRQMSDVATSLAGGMSPFMILMQQGPQIADVFQSSNASIGAAMRQILFNTKTAAIGITAAIAGIGAVAISSEMALEKLSGTARALGSNRMAVKEFNRQADIIGVDPEKMNAELVGLAQKLREAQIAGGDLSDKLSGIGINIKSFDLSKPGEFARLFEQIADKVRNGSNELDKLNALKFLGLSEEFNRLFSEGSAAISQFARESAGAAEKATKPLEKKFQELRGIVSNVTKYIADKATEIAYAVVSAVTNAIESIISLIDAAKRKWAEFKAFVGGNDTTKAGVAADLNSKLARAQEGIFPPEYYMPVLNPNKAAEAAKQKTTDLSVFSTEKQKSGGKKAGATKSGTDQLKTYIDNLREAANVAQSEADNWSKGNIEREKAMALVKAENIAKQEGKTLSDAQREEIANLAGQAESAKAKVDALRESQDQLNDAMREFADMITSAFEDLLTNGKKLQDVLKDVSKLLTSSVLRGALTGEGMFGGMLGLSGKEGRTGGLIGAFMSSLPKFANGGTLGAGQWGIAGEAGPELIRGPANIAPMGRMSAAPVTVNLIGAPEGTKVSEKTEKNGQRRVDVVFDERVAASLASPYGANAMRGVYGMGQRIARR